MHSLEGVLLLGILKERCENHVNQFEIKSNINYDLSIQGSMGTGQRESFEKGVSLGYRVPKNFINLADSGYRIPRIFI